MALQRVTLVSSAARTASGDSGLINLPSGALDRFVQAVIELDVTAGTGTTPTLDVFIQELLPDGVNFNDVARFAQAVAGTSRRVVRWTSASSVEGVAQDAAMVAGSPKAGPIGSQWRVKWVIAGTTPSFTFSVSADLTT